jgi:hypothetical protein
MITKETIVTDRNRKVGDIVWDEIMPTSGPLAGKTLGIKRGRVIDVLKDPRGRMSVRVEWEGDFEPSAGKILAAAELPEHQRSSTKFDWGVMSAKEIGIIVEGGLLDGKDGDFSEAQCPELKALNPLYRLAIEDPHAAVVINPEHAQELSLESA